MLDCGKCIKADTYRITIELPLWFYNIEKEFLHYSVFHIFMY